MRPNFIGGLAAGSLVASLLLGSASIARAATIVFNGGVDDLYSAANGAEPTNPSVGAVAAAGPSKDFDQGAPISVDVLHLFDLSSVSGTIVGATLDIRVRPLLGPGCCGAVNDVIMLRFYEDGGTFIDPDGDAGTDSNWVSRFGPDGSNPNFLQGVAWDNTLQPADGLLFSLDLTALPHSTGAMNLIPDLDVARFLDVRIADDSEVDFITLTVTTVPEPGVVALVGAALVLLGGRRRRAAT